MWSLDSSSCKDAIAAWNQDLNRILGIFNVRSIGNGSARYILMASFQTELGINTHLLVVDIHRNMVGNLVSMTFSVHQ